MRVLHLLLATCLCIALVVPADAWKRWRVRARFRFRARVRISRDRSLECKTLYGLGCPPSVAFTIGEVAPTEDAACAVRTISNCKRTLLDEEEDQEARDLVRVPFDADFKDYDDNKDGFITYDEFLDTLSSNVPLVDPSEVQKPFFDADIDGDGQLSEEEFAAAPFDFGDFDM